MKGLALGNRASDDQDGAPGTDASTSTGQSACPQLLSGFPGCRELWHLFNHARIGLRGLISQQSGMAGDADKAQPGRQQMR